MKDLGVLVVHHNEEIISVIERMFSHFKIRVDCVGSTTAALDRLKTKEYRTLITDMEISGKMSASGLTRQAMGLFPKLKVILFSGHSSESIMKIILDPKVSDISEEHIEPCTFNEMLQDIMNKKVGKVFLLEEHQSNNL